MKLNKNQTISKMTGSFVMIVEKHSSKNKLTINVPNAKIICYVSNVMI